MNKIFNIKNVIRVMAVTAILLNCVAVSYHFGYKAGYGKGYEYGDTQVFNCTDGTTVTYSKDELLHYKTQLLNAYDDALRWYYRGNKQEWFEVFMKTPEYHYLDSCLIDGWEDFYSE